MAVLGCAIADFTPGDSAFPSQELYIHHLVEAAYTQARLDKRKAVVYKDICEFAAGH